MRAELQGKTLMETLAWYLARPDKFIVLNGEFAQYEPSPLYVVYPVETFFETGDWQDTNGSYSLKKSGLLTLAGAMNISMPPPPFDPYAGTNPDFAQAQCVGLQTMPNGVARQMFGSKKIHVNAMIDEIFTGHKRKRDNGENGFAGRTDESLRQKAEGQRDQLRKFKDERAETGAMERMMRGISGMKTGWSKDDTVKIFVSYVAAPNMAVLLSDPNIRFALGMQAATGAAALYPAQTQTRQIDPPQSVLQITDGEADQTPNAIPADAPRQTNEQATQQPTAILLDEIEALLEERKHGLTEGQVRGLRNAPPDQMRNGIAYLRKQPMKVVAAPAHEVMPWDEPPMSMPIDNAPPPEPQASGMPWDNRPATPSRPQTSGGSSKSLTEAQIGRLYAIGKSAGYSHADVDAVIAQRYNGITSPSDLSYTQYDELCGNDKKNIPSWLKANQKGAQSQPAGENDGLPF